MKITHVRRNAEGEITDVKLDNGQEVNLEQAVQMAANKEIEDISVGHSKFGVPYLRKYPNGTTDDNLDNLPTF